MNHGEDDVGAGIVQFPRPLGVGELEQLLQHLGRDLVSEVEYQLTNAYRTGYYRITTEEIEPGARLYHSQVAGTIYFTDRMRWLTFSSTADECDEEVKYHALEFNLILGASEFELRRSATSNPDDLVSIRTSVRGYFTAHQP